MSFENGMKSIGVPLSNNRSLPGSLLSYYLTNLHPQGVGSKLKTCSLSNNKFERFIELGPSPTLTCMAVHTLKAKYEAKDDSTSRICHIFCALKDQKDIYYQFEDEPDANSELDVAAETEIPTPPPVAAAPAVVAPPVAPTTTAGPAISIEDVPIRAVDILAVIDSRKLKKQLSEIPLSKVAPSAMPLISLPAGEAPPHVVHEPTLPLPPTIHRVPSSQTNDLPPPPPPPRSAQTIPMPSHTAHASASITIRSTSSNSSHADNTSMTSAPQLRRRDASPSSSHVRQSSLSLAERHGHHQHHHSHQHGHPRSLSEPGTLGGLSSAQLTQAACLPVVRENGLWLQFGELWRMQRTVVIFIRHFWYAGFLVEKLC